MSPLRFRQVHLDFHTSPAIPEIGVDFDPDEFVATLKAAHVDSITVFAKCHHGYSYYPTKIGTPHPGLVRPNLLGEMIAALHKAGIRAPVYTTLTWDELAWETHPEWRQLTPEGCVGWTGTPLKPGWKNLCMNTGYGDYVIAQIEEVLDLYDGDGVFVDIVRYMGAPCVCATCLGQMRREGVDPTDPAQIGAFARGVERRFLAKCSAAIRAKDPDQSIFYNARLNIDADPELGNRPEVQEYSHFEIESLPGGFWGYDHFPLSARYFQTFGLDLLAMTGRFHTWWGDFGGLRNRAALAYECFTALAHGAASSIGDQLHPRGRLDPTVYRLIGEVYAEVEKREQWVIGSRPLPDIGVVVATTGGASHEGQYNDADRGVLHVLEQGKHQFEFVDKSCDLTPYKLVILPDEARVDAELAGKLRAYLKTGGKLLVTGRSGFDEGSGDFWLANEMGVHYAGPAPFAPDYLVVGPELAEGIEPMAYTCERQGVRVIVAPGAQVLASAAAPYFNRTWEHFCSHQYTPMDRLTDDAVVVQSPDGAVIYCGRPLFSEYAESARRIHKQVLLNCIARLLDAPRIGANNLPTTAQVTVRSQGDDLIVHLLHYVHQRRGKGLDVVEDVIPLHDVQMSVRSEQRPSAVQLVPEGESVAWEYVDGYVCFQLSKVEGYQIVQIVGEAEAR